MAGSGYTVRANELAAGGQAVASLQATCEKITSDAATAMAGLGEASSGHAALTAALLAAAEKGMSTFVSINAAYAYAGGSVIATAETYAAAENENARKAGAIRNGAR